MATPPPFPSRACVHACLLLSQDENKMLKNMPKAKRRALLKKKEANVDPRKHTAKNQVQMKGRTRSRMRVRV